MTTNDPKLMSQQRKPKRAKSPRTLYHLTPVENLAAILRAGLMADEEGAIYAFTNLLVANTIACNQVFASRYAIFEIEKRGVTGEVLPDDVAEFSRSYQRRIMQERIDPTRLRHMFTRDAIRDRPTPWDFLIGKKVFRQSILQVDEEFAIRRWVAEEVRAGRNRDAVLSEANERLAGL